MADRRDTLVADATTVAGHGSLLPTGGEATLRLSVILVGQRSLATQRRGRYVTGSGAHPARMAPDLAATLIAEYTEPGEWVFDPLAGVATTLVEAVHLGRHAYGIDIEPGWVALALARRQGGTGHARIV